MIEHLVLLLIGLYLSVVSCKITSKRVHLQHNNAEVAQSVERRLPKPKVAGSKPVFRSKRSARAGLFSRKTALRAFRSLFYWGAAPNPAAPACYQHKPLSRPPIAPVGAFPVLRTLAHSATALMRPVIPPHRFDLSIPCRRGLMRRKESL